MSAINAGTQKSSVSGREVPRGTSTETEKRLTSSYKGPKAGEWSEKLQIGRELEVGGRVHGDKKPRGSPWEVIRSDSRA